MASKEIRAGQKMAKRLTNSASKILAGHRTKEQQRTPPTAASGKMQQSTAGNRLPTLSVIIPLYNHRPYVAAAIRSIINQSYRDLEVIVIDDGSTDDSGGVVQAMMKDDNRIYYYRQDNQGVGMARNRGLQLARGRFIAWQDADDLSHHQRLERQMTFLEQHPQVAGVTVSYGAIDDSDHLFDNRGVKTKEKMGARLSTTQKIINFYIDTDLWRTAPSLGKSFSLCYANIMIRRDSYDLAKGGVGWHRRIRFGEDKDMFWRLQERFAIAEIEGPFYYVRGHGHSSKHRIIGRRPPPSRDQLMQTAAPTKAQRNLARTISAVAFAPIGWVRRLTKYISGRAEIWLGHFIISLSCYARRIYGRDPIDQLPPEQKIARWRYIFYFIMTPQVFCAYLCAKFAPSLYKKYYSFK